MIYRQLINMFFTLFKSFQSPLIHTTSLPTSLVNFSPSLLPPIRCECFEAKRPGLVVGVIRRERHGAERRRGCLNTTRNNHLDVRFMAPLRYAVISHFSHAHILPIVAAAAPSEPCPFYSFALSRRRSSRALGSHRRKNFISPAGGGPASLSTPSKE